MGERSPVGEFEQLILLAILRLGEEAYGVAIRDEIEETTGRGVARGAVYTTLDRLENKGLVRSWMTDPREVPGGRSRRTYAVEPAGIEAIEAARDSLRSMWDGLEPVLGEL